MPQVNRDILLNDFAIRSFRDTADRDYIHARMAYRARLVPQFQWSALHALEKYAKGILLLNRIPAKKLRHEVSGALDLIAKHGKFTIELSKTALDLIERLESGAEFRYFEFSYSNKSYDIARLDKAVSELRRYCEVLDWEIETTNGKHNALDTELERITHAAAHNHTETCITDGWLEQIINDHKHPAREPLIWNNLYFGLSKRKKVWLNGFREFGNAPLGLHPEILHDVVKYVFLPKNVIKAWREEFARRNAEDGVS